MWVRLAAMQKIIVEKPYQFLPPYRGLFWPWFFRGVRIHGYYLKKHEGIVAQEVRHVERLRASIAAGHAVLMTPNHPRTADPLAMGWIGVASFAMVSGRGLATGVGRPAEAGAPHRRIRPRRPAPPEACALRA